jgi:hypothetical protein
LVIKGDGGLGDFKKIATAQIDMSPLTGLEIFLSISSRG